MSLFGDSPEWRYNSTNDERKEEGECETCLANEWHGDSSGSVAGNEFSSIIPFLFHLTISRIFLVKHNSNPFKWRHYEPTIILLCVRWYCRYQLSYRDLEEMMHERGLSMDHTTVWSCVQRYAPEINKRVCPHLKLADASYRVDETYIKVGMTCKYLYRAIDSAGNTKFGVGIGLVVIGIIGGAVAFIVGVLVSAQGQTLMATLDSAVNNSPFLTNEHRADVMSL